MPKARIKNSRVTFDGGKTYLEPGDVADLTAEQITKARSLNVQLNIIPDTPPQNMTVHSVSTDIGSTTTQRTTMTIAADHELNNSTTEE